MYIRIVNFRSAPGKKPEIQRIADKFVPLIRAQKGCQGCKFIFENEKGEYGLVVTWDSKASADAARVVIGPQLIPELEAIAEGELSIGLYEAYEPLPAGMR